MPPPSFKYDLIFSERSLDSPRGPSVKHAKYDFAVAYPAPETLPLQGLISLKQPSEEKCGKILLRIWTFKSQMTKWKLFINHL